MFFSLSACGKNEPQKEYYQNTDLDNLETFSSVTGIELNITEDAPESNAIIYNYLMDNNADALSAVLKYEAYLEEYGFEKSDDYSEYLSDELTAFAMDGYLIVTGKFSPQANVVQYAISVPGEKTLEPERPDNKQEESETEPTKDEATIYSEFCQLVDDGKYTDALDVRKRENLSLDYNDTRNYYYYATAMQLYKETEFLTFQDISTVVKLLDEDISEGFKDSADIAEKINADIDRLIGTHLYVQIDEEYKNLNQSVYLAYSLIIDDEGNIMINQQTGKNKPLDDGVFMYKLVYVNLEKLSGFMICADYHEDIDHCKYYITIQPDYITLSKAWSGQHDIYAGNYTKIS